ncbi:metallophosphoesterase family protein [Sphingomonas oryzagri]
MEEADGWLSRERLDRIVAEVNSCVGDSADFVFLPGDNANHATPEQYRMIVEALDPLLLPWRAIAGDHDFEPGDLANFEAAIPIANRPESEVIAGHRCIFLDIVSAGAGGPDFRVTRHHRNRLLRELARAEAEDQTALVFMHAYPGDLAADGTAIAQALGDAGVGFVDTGHTHYSELLNDGRVIYGATRSTGQIEEGNGKPGFSIVCVHDRNPSWRFRELDGPWPHVQIVSPCDIRLMTRPSDPRQVPRPGEITISAKLFGTERPGPVFVRIDGSDEEEMWLIDGLWSAKRRIDEPGLHRIEVLCGDASDQIEILVRDVEAVPKRDLPVAPGHDCHAIGAWPVAGIEGTQLGPNKNGRDW